MVIDLQRRNADADIRIFRSYITPRRRSCAGSALAGSWRVQRILCEARPARDADGRELLDAVRTATQLIIAASSVASSIWRTMTLAQR